MSQQNHKLFMRITGNSYRSLSKLIKPSMSLDSDIGSLGMSPGCSDEDVVRKLFVFIKDNLIFESLQDGLMQKKLLNEKEKEEHVCSNCARHYWSERLLKLIIKKKRCKEFVAFIHQMACHKHVSEKILEVQEKAKGGTLKAANGAVQRRLNLTLTHELMQRHFACLYMELEPREIADEMFQAGHLTVREHDNVTESNQRYKRLSFLLNILMKKELYAQLVCTLQSLGYMSVLDTLQKDRKLKNEPSEYSTCIQHNFILLQENIPCFGDARFLMEHELDPTNISDIESCKNPVRKISKLLKILLIRGKSACKEFFRVMEVDLKSEHLIQKMKYKSAEIKRRGKPNLNQRHRSLRTPCLQEHEEFLNDELEPLDICDLLFEEGAMEISAHDKITETSRRQKQMKYLLETVNGNENDCFHFFLYILHKEGYESILEELKKSAPGAEGAVPHEQSENLSISLRVAREPDDVGNGDIHMRLSVGGRTGPQVEQVLQDSYSSGTEILEEAILHGIVDIRGVSSGSIVLQLRPVTDQAVQTLLNVRDNNRLVEMIVGMLKKVNIASMMDGTEPLEIKVQVYKANPLCVSSKAEDAEPIKKRLKAHRNVLVSELEPRAIAHVLFKSKAFAKSAIDSVLNAESCNDRVENLLSLVEDGDSEVVKEFVTALKDLGYSSIVELIDPPDIHNRAENIRKLITSNYKNILEEMQMKLAKETLSKCVGDVDEIREKILPKNGNRKKRMSSFLQFILQDDHNVIEFEKTLRNNDLEDLLKIDENVQGEHIPTQGIELTFVEDRIHSSSEGVLFEAVITLSQTVKSDRKIQRKVGKVSEETGGQQGETGGQQGETGAKQLDIDFEKMHLDESPPRPQRLDTTPTSPDIPLKGNESISSVSSSTSLKSIISDAEEDKNPVQKGYLFMLEHIHEETQLLDDLCNLCKSPLSDDEKMDMRDGKGYFKKREILKCLTSKGITACREFLEKFKCYQNLYSQLQNAVQSVTNTDGLLQDFALTNDGLVDYAEILLEEMEPSSMSDILFCYGLLNSAMHAKMDSRELNRRQKARILLDKTREQPDKMPVFCHALVKTECCRAIEYIKKGVNNKLPPFRSDSVRCVQVNFRKVLENFKDCIRKEVLFRYMRRRGYIDHNNVPKECVLIKAGLRGRKPGCDCILELTRQQDLALLEKMFRLLDDRKAHPRERTLDFGSDVLRKQRQFFLENLEPTPVSHILLEEEAFSVDDHDAVNNEKRRRKKVEVLIDILEKNGSELTLESFFFALRDDKFMMEKINEFRQAGAEVHTDRRPLQNIRVTEVGQSHIFEATVTASRFDVIVSIPVEGNEERISQAVEQLDIDLDFKAEIAEVTHMTVDRVEMRPVVLRLIAMTDNASERLLAKNGETVMKLVETFLKFFDLKEEVIKGNIKVTVLVPEEEIERGDQTMASDKEIKVKKNWNMLVKELEPSILAKKLLEKGVLNDSNVTAINSENTRKGKVECLLNMLPTVKGIDAYGALFESLHELGKSDIVEKIRPSENMHQEAEKVRYGLLSRLNEVIDEIESEFIEETFKQCGFLENPMDKVKSDMSKSRKERALNFLMSIFVNDAFVLAFKNVLDSYKLDPLYELKMPIDESIFSKSPRTTCKRSKGEKLFECEYKVIRKGEEVEDSHMTKEAAYSKMDWESYGLIESKRQPDESKPKRFEPKKRDIKLEPKPRSMHQAQAAVQPKRIFGRSGDDGSKEEWWSVVVALDFGTTYSGYAFWRKDNDPLDITPGKWKTESKEVLESLKTPTSLLLNKENKIIEFGFEAEKIFKELVEDGNDEEYRFFHQFKMLLHDKKSFNMDMLIKDHLDNPIKALDVFSLSIQYLKDECIELFQKKHINVANDGILWILTVPAIWDESAKQFMRKAAEQAEIPSDQLKLALEPEAAAIYVVKGAKTVFGKECVTTVKPGTKIMLADLGGGTADLTVLELNEDKTMKQLHRSFGGAWGGNLINKKIWEILTNVFGEEVIAEFKKLTSDCIDMESIIELRKRDISTGSKLQLQILPSLADLCKTIKGKGYKQLVTESGYTNVKVRTGKLSFEPDLVEEIFDLTLTNLYTSVEKVLHNQNMKGIKDIILVGGFAQADFIVKQFKERFSGYNVIIPTDPVLAVLKGAVMFGQDIDIISSRITAHTYGFDSMRYFTEGIDPRFKKRKIDNTFYCVDVFEKMVAIGESVDVGKTVEKEVFASSKDMRLMVLNFYQSDKKDPKFVTDDGCECIGKLSVEMPDLSGGTERSVRVSIKFGETEIEVCGEDKTTGKKQETKLNFLGDTK